MEFNIEELRKQKRPLWMTNLAVESMAEILVGAGGDIRTDRLSIDSDRMTGKEIEKNATQKRWNSFSQDGKLARTISPEFLF